ncbi:prohibitin family protein [Fulvivirgaceae bacterium BMA10]|uniref:Prohibitin family protein n=1 Tax=Splendidivirga corallicola TaxID=3051826 RepID=A0ABT8KSX9_9BACT|nr:prohibitin family protein [Fulvivirgaceae bacterium BMA10]
MDNRKFLPVIVIGVIALVVVIALSSSIFYTIQAGEKAVIFKKFGGGLDKENIIGQGFGFKAPWNDLHVYDVRETSTEEQMDVLDKNGLSINVDVTVRFHPIYLSVGYLHENFGQDYVNRLVVPEVRSAVRQVMGRYSAEEIYSTKRGEVESGIKAETEKTLGDNYIQMKTLLIRSINLPEQIKLAIENKLKQEQEALAYQFRLEKEKSEAERKRIAAEGEARANQIINSSLTNNLLKMRGIEATTSLANSPNSKVVVIGSGGDGLPLILGNN